MDAKGLRIGNIVCNKSAENTESVVCGISNQGMIRFDYNIRSWYELRDIEPIPLTEEWLLKFGFENDRNGYRLVDKYSLSISCDKDNKLHPCYGDRILLNAVTLDYVHQLQNLYYALTGEELIIKKV
jgi:hypothetical protein